MPDEIALYRVFIATPGGLEAERRAFARILNTYNTSEAIHRQALFLPVGWEDTLAGIGRPQSLINEDLDRCDYFFLILWDRWGTPPGGDPAYTSGTEEEYGRALEHLSNSHHRLSRVVVLFKHIDEQRLRDPGSQLQRVLEFKRRLEASRRLLFSTFIEATEFEEMVRRHLAEWLRQHDYTFTRRVARERARATDSPASVATDVVAPGLVVTPASIDPADVLTATGEEVVPEDPTDSLAGKMELKDD